MNKEMFERMLAEYQELVERTGKLIDFINDDKFNELDALNKDLCITQVKAMETYLGVLSIRIGYNAPENNEIIEEEA